MDILLLAANAVAPIFLMMVFGYYLKYKGIINQKYIDYTTRIVFRFALPSLVFMKIATIDNNVEISDSQYKLLMFSFVGVIAAFIITTIITRIYHKVKGNDNPGYLGAMNQGSWRSNYLIVGYPVLYNLYGDAMILNYALVILVVIPMYNVLATLALSNNKGIKSFDDLKDIVTKLLQNPLIIAVIVGFVFNLLGIKIPMVATNFLNMIGGLATPLGLIAIGAFFHFDELKKSLSKSVIVTSLKLLVYPLIATTVAYFLGFSQMDIVMIAVLFGGPTSVSSFAMAKEMKSDPVLAGNIVILTSALCAFTYMIVISMWLSIA